MIDVMLDPGHVGRIDPGAIGAAGNRESDINYLVACKVMKILITQYGLTCALSHEGKGLGGKDANEEVMLRAAVVKKCNPKASVSIHCNSVADRSAHGIETYAYKSGMELAESIQSMLVAALGLTDRGVKTASLAMIREPAKIGIPAALVEMGFISNAAEEKLLWSAAGQDKAAKAIADGIGLFLKAKVITDHDKPSPWDITRQQARDWAMSKGITDGSNPTDPCSREQVWIMLQKLYK